VETRILKLEKRQSQVEQQSRDCYTTLQKFVAAFTDENKNIVSKLEEK
jgi:hypothetical protein